MRYRSISLVYPQRNEGNTENLVDGIKSIVASQIAEGKVDANRIYISSESAGSIFTINFVSRHPGYCTATYQKLVNLGMKPGVDAIWHYYTAEKFNALLGDRIVWQSIPLKQPARSSMQPVLLITNGLPGN